MESGPQAFSTAACDYVPTLDPRQRRPGHRGPRRSALPDAHLERVGVDGEHLPRPARPWPGAAATASPTTEPGHGLFFWPAGDGEGPGAPSPRRSSRVEPQTGAAARLLVIGDDGPARAWMEQRLPERDLHRLPGRRGAGRGGGGQPTSRSTLTKHRDLRQRHPRGHGLRPGDAGRRRPVQPGAAARRPGRVVAAGRRRLGLRRRLRRAGRRPRGADPLSGGPRAALQFRWDDIPDHVAGVYREATRTASRRPAPAGPEQPQAERGEGDRRGPCRGGGRQLDRPRPAAGRNRCRSHRGRGPRPPRWPARPGRRACASWRWRRPTAAAADRQDARQPGAELGGGAAAGLGGARGIDETGRQLRQGELAVGDAARPGRRLAAQDVVADVHSGEAATSQRPSPRSS